jgi:hypothetical protein
MDRTTSSHKTVTLPPSGYKAYIRPTTPTSAIISLSQGTFRGSEWKFDIIHELDPMDPYQEKTMISIYVPTEENGKFLRASNVNFFPPSVQNHFINLPGEPRPRYWSLQGLTVKNEQDTGTESSSANPTGVSVEIVFNRPGYVYDCVVKQFSALSAVVL